MKIHLRHFLYMLYSCTKAIQPLTIQAIKLVMRTVPTHPDCRVLCLHRRANPARMRRATPRLPPKALLSLSGSLHYTRSAADFSRIQLGRDFQDAPGPPQALLCVRGLHSHVSPSSAHGGPAWGGAVEVQDNSVPFQQLWAEEISCLWGPRGLQTPGQQQRRQWQILHFNALKGGRIQSVWKYTDHFSLSAFEALTI